MRIVNSTSLDTSWLEQMVELVRPEGLAGDYLIEFLPDDLPHGLADPHLRLARIFLGGEQYLPFTWRRCIKTRTMVEAAVFITAHELRHLYQAEAGMRMRSDPKERSADAYAARCLRRWRQLQAPAHALAVTSTKAKLVNRVLGWIK